MALFSGRSDGADDEDDGQGPWGSRGFIASVIVVGAVVVCGLAWLVLGESGTPTGTSSPTPTVQPTSQPTGEPPTTGPTENPATPVDPTPVDPTSGPTTQPRGAGCRIPPGDQRITSSAPTGVDWKFEGGMLIPTKPTIGPGARDSRGVWRCFAHSPIGSVFAAMITLAQVQDQAVAPRVIEQRVAPGPGKNRALAEARAVLRNPTPRLAGATVQFVGFKIVDYTSARTVLSVAVQVDPEHIGGMAVTMRWVSGDWRLELRSDGSISGDPDVLGSLDGYVRFRGA